MAFISKFIQLEASLLSPSSWYTHAILSLCRTPDLGYDFASNSGRVFNYYSYGVSCSEVEIDCLTGAHKVRQFFGPRFVSQFLALCVSSSTKEGN